MGYHVQPVSSRLRRGLSGVFFAVPAETPSWSPAPSLANQSRDSKGADTPPPRPAMRAPATIGTSGRRMTYEEALAQQILQMNQTIDGSNHLAASSEIIIRPPTSDRNGRNFNDALRSRLPFTYMGIQGQAPAQILLPAIGAAQVVVSFTCPARQNGEIEFVANQFVGGGWTEGSGTIIWQVLIDGVPVQGYDAILGSMGSTASPGWLGKGAIQFSEGQLVQLRVTNVSIPAAAQVLLGLLRGHFEPVDTRRSNTW